MNEIEKFNSEVTKNIKRLGKSEAIKQISSEWVAATIPLKYTYNFEWLGRPIIQYPQDIVALQEVMWRVKPDLIIETGIAHGGSLILSASILAILDYQEAYQNRATLDPHNPTRRVLGIDIDIRPHNRHEIEAHPLSPRIDMLQGSSVEDSIIAQVQKVASQFDRVMVVLDSNHTHDHVLKELEAYAPLTSIGSYCVVMDTAIEDVSAEFFTDRPWGPGDNPKTAIWEYLEKCSRENNKGSDGNDLNFKIDKKIDNKTLISVAPDGFLARI
jgi:cephalosporin hydroxylase